MYICGNNVWERIALTLSSTCIAGTESVTDAILNAFHQHHPPALYEQLYCYLIHYGITDWTWIEHDPYAKYNSLLTLVHEQKLEGIYVPIPNTSICPVPAYNYMSVTYYEGYGKVCGDDQGLPLLSEDQKLTVWDIIMKNDDINSLSILLRNSLCEAETLMRIAKRYGAKRCFQAFKDTMKYHEKAGCTFWYPQPCLSLFEKMKYVLMNAASDILYGVGTRFSPLERVFQTSCDFQGRTTVLQCENAVVLWDIMNKCTAKPPQGRQFLADHEKEFLQRLLHQDLNVINYCAHQATYLLNDDNFMRSDFNTHCVSFLGLHCKVVLDSWQVALNRKYTSCKTKIDSFEFHPTPMDHVLIGRILCTFENAMQCTDIYYLNVYTRTILLLGEMSMVFLQSGEELVKYQPGSWLNKFLATIPAKV